MKVKGAFEAFEGGRVHARVTDPDPLCIEEID
jgi:hypothetical protein